jgi:hypothetical protein
MYFLIFPPPLHLPFFFISLTNRVVGVADALQVMVSIDLHLLLLLSLQWAWSFLFILAFPNDFQ